MYGRPPLGKDFFGILANGSGSGHVFAPWIAAFVARLRELGWIDGRTVPIEYQWSEGRTERYAEIAAQFVRQKVDVIVTIGSAVPTVRHATSVIPIVFAVAIDPVGAPQKSQPFEVAFGLMKSSIQREPLFGQPTPGIVPGPTPCHRCPGSRTPT
jgi:ABC transporter substrate binding protein